jgi:hypothetical protein
VTGKNSEAASSRLSAATDKPLEIIQPPQKETVPMGRCEDK